MKKHVTFFLAALGLCCALAAAATPAQAAAYPDIESHWAKPAIERWSDSGILKGYSDGRFAPNDPISRAQLSEILYRVWGCKTNSARTFTDVSPDAWYYDGLTTMATYGVTITDGDKAHPDELLTREEAFYMVARAFDIGTDGDGSYLPSQVSDGADISLGYRGRLTYMFNAKHLKGGSDGKFQPKRTVTRAEVIQVMDNMFDLYIDKPGTYNLGQDQVALVTSPGVTLNTTKGRSDPNSHVYVMNKVFAAGDLTLTCTGNHGTVRLHGVSDDLPVWKTEGDGFWVDPAGVVVLSDPQQVPRLDFAGGTGALADPYHIATGEQFLEAMKLPSQHPSTQKRMVYYFKLDNDVDLGTLPESLSTPMYFNLDGNGHTVTYRMEGELGSIFGDVGLFESLTSEEVVHDLTVAGKVDVTLTDPTNIYENKICFGGLAGVVSRGELNRCHSQMDITIRYAQGEIVDLCVGGLVGRAAECTLTDCTSQAQVTTIVGDGGSEVDCHVGGLVGVASQATYGARAPGVSGSPPAEKRKTILRQCGSSAKVSVTGSFHASAGGLVGLLTRLIDPKLTFEGYGIVEDCWSTADVSVAEPVFQGDCGGLVGHFAAGTIRRCWAAPTLRVDTDPRYTFQNLGGIVGSANQHDEIHLTDCWANVSGLTIPEGDGHYGGIVGRLNGEVARCFVLGNEAFEAENALSYASWTDVKPTDCFSMAEKTAGDLTAFYQTCGWNFVTVWDNSGGYPILRGLPAEAQRAAQGR